MNVAMNLDNLNECPYCKTSLIGPEIPEQYRDSYNPPYHYKREIGIEYPELYDGVFEWQCPDCNGIWDSELKKLRESERVV